MNTGRFLFDGSYNGNMFVMGNGDSVFRGSRSLLNMDETPIKKRPFFSYSDEFIEEEFYDEQLPEKKRRLTTEQVHLLEKSFALDNKLEPDRKTELAKKLGLQSRQVAIWFQNRRARWKTKQLERDYDVLKASYDSLLSNYDAMVKENEKIKSEVVSLTEKLQAKDVTGIRVELGHKNDLLLPTNDADVVPIPISVKAEDHLSSGSAVVDEDSPQLVDSGDSYFPDNDYHLCMGQVDGIHSEEDDGSEDGRGYFTNVFAAVQQQEVTEPSLGWCQNSFFWYTVSTFSKLSISIWWSLGYEPRKHGKCPLTPEVPPLFCKRFRSRNAHCFVRDFEHFLFMCTL